MVAGDLKTPEMVIEGKCQVGDEPVGPGLIPAEIGVVVVQVLDDGLFDDRQVVVEGEGNLEGVGIDDDTGQQEEQQCRKRPSAKGIHVQNR